MLFFFNDTPTSEIYTLSLHDALPISSPANTSWSSGTSTKPSTSRPAMRWEEHTSELQSQFQLVCRLLLEKKTQLAHTDLKHYGKYALATFWQPHTTRIIS